MYKNKELNKLEKYLKKNNYNYTRIEKEVWIGNVDIGRHQIVVFNENGDKLWDVICQYGSEGHADGLLEAMGAPVVKYNDRSRIVGCLSADDVIKRLEDD